MKQAHEHLLALRQAYVDAVERNQEPDNHPHPRLHYVSNKGDA